MEPSTNSENHWKLPYIIEHEISESVNTPIIAITESWLKSKHTDAQAEIPGYQILRADREGRDRGGSLLYIHNNLSTKTLKFMTISSVVQ